LLRKAWGSCGVKRNDCNSNHSETKPLNGGRPAMDSVPTSARLATQGMRRIRPPSFPRLRCFVAWSTEPVVRKSRLLKNAWLREWTKAAVKASGANRGLLLVANRIDKPIPVKISPTFSIDEYANNRFMSVCTEAKI